MGDIFFNIKRIFNKEYQLVYQLKKEHKNLFKIYRQIDSKIKKRDFKEIHRLLELFYLRYKKHVLLEDNYFYAKLNSKYKEYENVMDFINLTKDELNDLTSSLDRFLLVYSSEEMIEKRFKEFLHDFEALGERLKERVEFEENRLYILY